MNNAAFYRIQAEQARVEATQTLLENVRDRCLRSAHAWDQMAGRAERADKNRAERVAASAREIPCP